MSFPARQKSLLSVRWQETNCLRPITCICREAIPEFFVEELNRNVKLGEQLRDFAANGGRIFAECGGMMYLCKELISRDGDSYPMAGVLPLTCTLEKMRLHLGYRTAHYRGMQLKGHEFHYSSVVQPDLLPSEVSSTM